MSTALATFSQEATRRLKKPPRRGMFEPVDAARAQQALLSVGDDQGQLRVYWLVDIETKRIEDARYLSFGDLTSHPVGDAFTELCRETTVSEACAISAEAIEAALRDEADSPAFGDLGMAPVAPIAEIQAKALAEVPNLKLLPKPVEVQRYERKRQQDWDDADKAWFPLSLLRKLAKVNKALSDVLANRLKRSDISFEVEGLHEDFQIKIKLTGAEAEEVATVLQFFQSELRQDIHPNISVEEA